MLNSQINQDDINNAEVELVDEKQLLTSKYISCLLTGDEPQAERKYQLLKKKSHVDT